MFWDLPQLPSHWLLSSLSLFLLGFYVLFAIEQFIGNCFIKRLLDIPELADADCPTVSIIIAARNEARDIEAALHSVLRLDYPNFEVIVVNDRSEDETGKILTVMAEQYSHLRVIHIETLPAGWLGKNHALHYGSQQSQHDYILFTDADVHFAPSTLKRAMNYMHTHQVDHLAGLPQLTPKSPLLSALGGSFTVFFNLYNKPWWAKLSWSKRFIGIGAFNLMKRLVYNQTGGLAHIPMRPDDDMKLGKLIKHHGYKQDLVFGTHMITLAWYPKAVDLINGLLKNTFAFVGYNPLMILGGVLAQFVFNIWPFIAVWVSPEPQCWQYLTTVCFILFTYIENTRHMKLAPWPGLIFPLVSAVFIYIALASMGVTLKNQGIYWRNTFYPLQELKRNAF